MKRFILGFLFASIIFIGIGVFAYNYKSENVTYTPSDESWNVNNVKDAVDDIYNNIDSSIIKSFVGGNYYSVFYINGSSKTSGINQSAKDVNNFSDIVSELSSGTTYAKIKKAGYYIALPNGNIYDANESTPRYLNVGDQIVVGTQARFFIIYLGETNPFE